jgi:hypothetical protein
MSMQHWLPRSIILGLFCFAIWPNQVATAQTNSHHDLLENSFEGTWAKTKQECHDDDGPNSKTLVDLGNVVDGKPEPIIDQYENHCLVESRKVIGDSTIFSVTCYEFWENLEKLIEGRKATIKLSASPRGLKIDGKMHQRCEAALRK